MYNYIVCSGWWGEINSSIPWHLGIHRLPIYFDFFYEQITSLASPRKIFVVDSCTPSAFVPSLAGKEVEWVRLDRNYERDDYTKYNGWTRAFILGMTYAKMCEAHYAVWVEQDTLLWGKGIIDYAIEHMKDNRGVVSYNPCNYENGEQCLVVIDTQFVFDFIRAYCAIPSSDAQTMGEAKFVQLQKQFPWGWLPFPWGREHRGSILSFDEPFGYAQKLEEGNYLRFMQKCGSANLNRAAEQARAVCMGSILSDK